MMKFVGINDILQANPPQLHSNLLYIQRYRRQSRLVGEAAYFFTNIQSVESFISNIDAKSISMDESEYENNMELARTLLSGLSADSDSQYDISGYSDSQYDQSGYHAGHLPKAESTEVGHHALNVAKDPALPSKLSNNKSRSKETPHEKDQSSLTKVPSLSDLESKGAELLLKEDQVSQVFQEYPYLFACVGDLTINNVEDLLNSYKQLVLKYVTLSRGLGNAALSLPHVNSQTQVQQHPETVNKQGYKSSANPNDDSEKDTSVTDVGSSEVSHSREET